jgi:hypothetical protein
VLMKPPAICSVSECMEAESVGMGNEASTPCHIHKDSPVVSMNPPLTLILALYLNNAGCLSPNLWGLPRRSWVRILFFYSQFDNHF